jgi:hypothetical protein
MVSSLFISASLTHATELATDSMLLPKEIPTALRLSTTCSHENCRNEACEVFFVPFFGLKSKSCVALILSARSREGSSAVSTLVGVNTGGTVGRQLRPKILDTISFLQLQTAGEPYTPYQKMAPPLQAEEEGPSI